MSIKRTVATFVASSMIFLGSAISLNDKIEEQEEEIDNLRNKLEIEKQLSDSEIAELEGIVEKKNKRINQLDSKLEEKVENYEELKSENKKLKKENEKLKQKQVVEVSQGGKLEPKSSVKSNYDSTMIVTAYTAGYESTQKRKGEAGYGQTASGAYVKEGRTLACPPSMPFGTIVDIEGIGQRVCEDRGSAIVEGHLDLYIADLSTAQNFGRQELKVKVVK